MSRWQDAYRPGQAVEVVFYAGPGLAPEWRRCQVVRMTASGFPAVSDESQTFEFVAYRRRNIRALNGAAS